MSAAVHAEWKQENQTSPHAIFIWRPARIKEFQRFSVPEGLPEASSQRGGSPSFLSMPSVGTLKGISSTSDSGVFSFVGRSLIAKAWPPIEFAEPGRMSEVVTPPETVRLNARS